MTLSTRLHSLADTVDALPEPEREALGRALRRFERDRHLRHAVATAGGVAAFLRLLDAQGWRVRVWLSRGKVPALADPALAALFEALRHGPCPTARHLRRICGHGMSETLSDTGSSYLEN